MSTLRPIDELRSVAQRALGTADWTTLQEVLHDLDEHDTDLARSIAEAIQGMWYLQRGELDRASDHYRRSYEFAERSGDQKRIATATLNLGTVAEHHGDHAQAVDLSQQALSLYREAKDYRGVGYAANAFASTLVRLDRLEEARELLLRTIADVMDVEDRSLKARLMTTLGIIASRLDSYEQAVEYHTRALEYGRLQGDLSAIATAESNLGSMYGDLGDNSTAIEYYLRSLQFAHEGEIPGLAFAATVNLGSSYMDLGDFPTAKGFLEQGLEIATSVQNKAGIAHATANLGVIAMHLQDLITARGMFEKAASLAESIGERGTEILALVNLYECLIELEDSEAADLLEMRLSSTALHDPRMAADFAVTRGRKLHRSGSPQEAINVLDAALNTARERGIMISQVGLLSELCTVYRAAGNLEAYIEANDALQDVKERLRGASQQRRISVQEKQQEIEQRERELERHRTALYATLPQHVAERVLKGEQVNDNIDSACVLFLDIAGFTALSSTVPAGHVVHLLEAIFGACDDVIHRYDLTKVKTIGDSYMAVAGVVEDTPDPVGRMASAALDLMQAMNTLQVTMPPELGDTSWVESIPELKVRIGIDRGPVVAGIVGKDRLQYDVWGDTVNTASRMESTGEPGRIQVSEALAKELTASSFSLIERGAIDVKGKGTMTTYWLER